MPNASYRKGAEDERKFRAVLEERGMRTSRGAGSHGTDLFAFVRGGGVFALDLKRGDWAGPEARKSMARWHDFGVHPWLVRCDAGPGRPRRWTFRRVDEYGRMEEVRIVPPWLALGPSTSSTRG